MPSGAKVCDVGTDHGYLAAALYKSGRVKSVIATDIKEKPLNNAKENLKRLNVGGVSLRLCDGLEGVNSGEADTVIVLGMGGEVIAGILSRAEWIKNEDITLILQPMTSAWELRKYLYSNGFDIVNEPTLCEKGKVYSVIVAKYDGKVRDFSMFDCCVGKIEAKSDSDIIYLKKQFKRCNQCALKMENIEEKRQEFLEYTDVATKLKGILEERNAI